MSKITRHKIYERQTTLQEIGASGQQKLSEAKVVIIGCGGLGSVAAVYLAASGIGNIHLVDFDVVDVSNLHRQVFYTTDDIGKPKSKVLSKYIESISPFININFSNTAVSKANVIGLLGDADIVLDCTDSLSIKYLLNDVCVLQNKILVYGSLYKFDGYVATFNLEDKEGKRTANLRDAFPEIPTEKVPNCSEIGTLNTIVGIIGLMQANEVLKIVTGVGKPLVNELLIFNSLDNSQYKMKLKSEFSKERISEIFKDESYKAISCEVHDELEITSEKFKEILTRKKRNYTIVSVIENTAQEIPFQVDVKKPLSELDDWIFEEFIENENYIFVCNRGVSSMIAVTQIKEEFPQSNVLSLAGGIVDY